MSRLGWMEDALCAQVGDVDLFHPEKGSNTSTHAKRICNGHTRTYKVGRGKEATEVTEVIPGCPVRDECLAYALHHDAQPDTTPQGVYGGMTVKERNALRKEALPTCPSCGVTTSRNTQGRVLVCDECASPSAMKQRRAKGRAA